MLNDLHVPEASFIQIGGRNKPVRNFNAGRISQTPILNFSRHPMFETDEPNDIDDLTIPEMETVGEVPVEKTGHTYNIINLFWLYNEKISRKETLGPNETHFCTLAYNCNFGNVRLDFFEMPSDAISGHVVFLNKLNRKATGCIYPASIFKILTSKTLNTTCMEQLITHTGEPWQSQRPKCVVNKTENNIIITIEDHMKNCFTYDFNNWQKEALVYAFKFALNQGFSIMGQNNK